MLLGKLIDLLSCMVASVFKKEAIKEGRKEFTFWMQCTCALQSGGFEIMTIWRQSPAQVVCRVKLIYVQ